MVTYQFDIGSEIDEKFFSLYYNELNTINLYDKNYNQFLVEETQAKSVSFQLGIFYLNFEKESDLTRFLLSVS